MNGFAKHDLNEDDFGEKAGAVSALRTFDAFPKTKSTYTSTSQRGGQWTIIVLILCAGLVSNELLTWYRGSENHHFSVERGVSREMQFNIDIVVAMQCEDVRINLQDAAGDHTHAGELLTKEDTTWSVWDKEMNRITSSGANEYQTLSQEDPYRLAEQEEDRNVEHVLGEVRRSRKKKFPRGPKLNRKAIPDACRVYGSLEGNKVRGDLHITPRGHGYFEWSAVSAQAINFTHIISELSFGPHYTSILNPLDKTVAINSDPLLRYQYHLSVVPTIYTKAGIVDPNSHYLPDPSSISPKDPNTIFTNQYAVTSHTRNVQGRGLGVPGVFFSYNIEPILLVVSQERGSLLALLVRLVNVMSGVLVSGGWLFQIATWAVEVIGRRSRQLSEGLLTGKPE